MIKKENEFFIEWTTRDNMNNNFILDLNEIYLKNSRIIILPNECGSAGCAN